MLVFYSTVPGYYSFRETDGSWLMSTLTAVLDAYLRPKLVAPAGTLSIGGGGSRPFAALPGVSVSQHSAIDSSAPSTRSSDTSTSTSSASGTERYPAGEAAVDMFALLTLVQRAVAVKFESHTMREEDHLKKQVPQLCSTLTRCLHFPVATPEPS